MVERVSRKGSSLFPSLLAVARDNLHRQVDEIRFFEIARAFLHNGNGELPVERLTVTALVTQSGEKQLWQPAERVPLFFIAKGIAEKLVAGLGREIGFAPGAKEPYLHPGAAASIVAGKRVLGVVGELHPACAVAFEIDAPCAIVELHLSDVAELPTREFKYSEVSRFPLMRRDLAVLLERDQQAGEVLDAIRQKAGAHLRQVEIFDRYEGKGVPDGKVSLAFRLTYQRGDRTLTDAEVTKATDRVVQMLAHRFGGELR